MSLDKSDIKNFDLLCQLLKEWDRNPDDPFVIHEMLDTEGYTEWLVRILAHVDHRFWKRLITHSGLSWSLILEKIDHFFDLSRITDQDPESMITYFQNPP